MTRSTTRTAMACPDPISYENDAFFAQDSLQYSIMSYWDAYETGAQHIDWSLLNFAYAATPLVHDIAAIQAIYGADPNTRTGDTVYGFNSTADRSAFDFDAQHPARRRDLRRRRRGHARLLGLGHQLGDRSQRRRVQLWRRHRGVPDARRDQRQPRRAGLRTAQPGDVRSVQDDVQAGAGPDDRAVPATMSRSPTAR